MAEDQNERIFLFIKELTGLGCSDQDPLTVLIACTQSIRDENIRLKAELDLWRGGTIDSSHSN